MSGFVVTWLSSQWLAAIPNHSFFPAPPNFSDFSFDDISNFSQLLPPFPTFLILSSNYSNLQPFPSSSQFLPSFDNLSNFSQLLLPPFPTFQYRFLSFSQFLWVSYTGRPVGRYYRPLVDNRPFGLNGRYSWICGRYYIKMVDILSKNLSECWYDISQDLCVLNFKKWKWEIGYITVLPKWACTFWSRNV